MTEPTAPKTTKQNIKWFITIYALSVVLLAVVAYGLKALLR